MPSVALYVARRALVHGVIGGLVGTAVIVAATELSGEGGRSLAESLEAAAVVAAAFCAFLVLMMAVAGVTHVRAIRTSGRPVDLPSVTVGQQARRDIPVPQDAVLDAAAKALKGLSGVRSVAHDPATGRLTAIRPVPGGRSFAQRLVVRVEGDTAHAVVHVRSAPRWNLSAWDMGQSATNVEDFFTKLEQKLP